VSTLAVADVDAQRRDALLRRLAAKAPGTVRAGTSDPAGFGIVVNATPAGMASGDPLPADAAHLDAAAIVADLITSPAITPFLEAARRRGATIVTGEDVFAVQVGTMADILLALPTT
jgi:shikimate dehydrogenase